MSGINTTISTAHFFCKIVIELFAYMKNYYYLCTRNIK